MVTTIELDDRYLIANGTKSASALGMTSSKVYDRVLSYLRQQGRSGGYSVGVADADDCLCFHFEDPFWTVYFSERGRRFNPCFFSSGMQGAEFFAREVVGDDVAPRLLDWKHP